MITVKMQDKIGIFTINVTNRPMNVINEEFLQALESVVAQYFQMENACAGYIFTSAREEFMVGADLDLLRHIEKVDDCLAITKRLHACFRQIEKSNKPVVACLAGSALGGGLELALACHFIVALAHEKVKIGLPEVSLGLIPGGGGTQRLPRMIGFEAALPIMLEGRPLSSSKAHELGIVTQLASSQEELLKKAKDLIAQHPQVQRPWDLPKYKIPGGGVQTPRAYQFFPVSCAMVVDKTWGNYPAAESLLKCVYEGLQLPFDLALKIEENYFAGLVVSPIAKNMQRTLFYSMNECKNGKSRPKLPVVQLKKIAVLGAGMMGAGIAYVSAKAGMQVVLKDIDVATAQKGKEYSQKILSKALAQGRSTSAEMETVLGRIEATDSTSSIHNCDLVIEAVIEDRNIKKLVTQESEKVISPDCIYSSNTSTLPITGLATYSKRPENFIGLHFFSPVDKMPLVEVILGEKTSPKALALCLDYIAQIGKTPIVVNDSRGFYTSRVFTSYITEGIAALIEGIAPAIIENAGKACGMPVGPLAVADEVSLDLIYHILKQTIADEGKDAVDQATFLLTEKFVTQLGRLGRKSGKGFYDYPVDDKKHLSPTLSQIYPLAESSDPVKDFEQMKLRLLSRQALESVRCLQEGVLRSVAEADVGSILGWGFPAYTGGTLSYIDYRGTERFIQDCQALEKRYGERFKVPSMLIEMQKEGRNFYA